jgi:hypothetical protein
VHVNADAQCYVMDDGSESSGPIGIPLLIATYHTVPTPGYHATALRGYISCAQAPADMGSQANEHACVRGQPLGLCL